MPASGGGCGPPASSGGGVTEPASRGGVTEPASDIAANRHDPKAVNCDVQPVNGKLSPIHATGEVCAQESTAPTAP